MIHTEEDDEFERIEHENAMKGQPYCFKANKEDDDIQDYVRPWVGLTDEDYIKALELCDFDKVAAFEFFEAKLKEKNT